MRAEDQLVMFEGGPYGGCLRVIKNAGAFIPMVDGWEGRYYASSKRHVIPRHNRSGLTLPVEGFEVQVFEWKRV